MPKTHSRSSDLNRSSGTFKPSLTIPHCSSRNRGREKSRARLTVPGFVSLSIGGSSWRIDLMLDLVAEATEQHVESLFAFQVIFFVVIDNVAQIE